MNTLADAWNWYLATKRSLGRHAPPRRKALEQPHVLADTSIRQDDNFRMLEARDIIDESKTSLEPIDDLAIVVLFSVFESRVRDHLLERIKPHAAVIRDPILIDAAEDAIRGVGEGSFFSRVLEPLKKQQDLPADLVTLVDQVRDYRNWVAHGRREVPTNNVTPQMAYERLSKFLEALGIAVESEEKDPNSLGRE